MKKIIFNLLTVILFITACESDTIGKYKKETLPEDFHYKILEDTTNVIMEKNVISIEINKKISEGQIATLAAEFYESRPKQPKFFIFYLLPGMKVGEGAWATSHFNPELEIEFIGTTEQTDMVSAETLDSIIIDGEIIGKWHEEKYTSSNYIIYKKDNKIFLKIIFKSGQMLDEELKEKNDANGTRFDYKSANSNGEYFILNTRGILEFYNKENKKYTIGIEKE